MKAVFLTLWLLLLSVALEPVASADGISENRNEADQLYSQKDFKAANKLYLKLAKAGDHYSQGRVAHMLANGEGTRADPEEAYAWSVLAEAGGDPFVTINSEQLLERIGDKPGAQKAAKKLKAKYGQKALIAKAQRRAESEAARRSSSSMGSNLSR